LRAIDQAHSVGIEAGFGDAEDFPVLCYLLRKANADGRGAEGVWRPQPMRIAAASLDRVIGLVRIRAERRAPFFIAEAAIERAIDGEWPVAQGTISNRGLQVVPQAIETRRRGRFSLGPFRGAADGPRDQHGANQLVQGFPGRKRNKLTT
jgi:hypothetical protein